MMRLGMLATVLLVVLGGCQPPRPGADAGLVVVDMLEAPAVSPTETRYEPFSRPVSLPAGNPGTTLVLSPYDQDRARTIGDRLVEVYLTLDSGVGLSTGRVGALVQPGRYVVSRFTQGGHWHECFGVATVQFEVAPHAVVDLGRLDARAQSRALAGAVARAGKQTLPGGGPIQSQWLWYDDPTMPALQAASAAGLVRTGAFVAAGFPAYAGEPVQPAVISAAHFYSGPTARNLGYRSCGGVFSTD